MVTQHFIDLIRLIKAWIKIKYKKENQRKGKKNEKLDKIQTFITINIHYKGTQKGL